MSLVSQNCCIVLVFKWTPLIHHQHHHGLSFTYSLTHSHTGGWGEGKALSPFWEQLTAKRLAHGLGAGFEPPTNWLLDIPLYLLSHSCPNIYVVIAF